MTLLNRLPKLLPAAGIVAALALLVVAAWPANEAGAQIPGSPPMTVFGSVTDSAGRIEAGLTVEAYIGDKLCGDGKTEFTGEGDGQITVYYVRIDSNEQTPGCGRMENNGPGSVIRIKIGDRFAEETTKWFPPFEQVDITFGSATPVAIPTFTPTPTSTPSPTTDPSLTPVPGSATTPGGAGETPGGETPGTPAPGETRTPGTIPAGSPGAGSPEPTPPGGVIGGPTDGAGNGGGGDGDGGFPIWAAIMLVLGGIAVVGGGIGYAMTRNRRNGPDAGDAEPFGRHPGDL